MQVLIKPIPKESWHGKDGKDSFSRPQSLEVLVDRETGKFATGLTPEQSTEYGKRLGIDLSDIFNPGEAHPYWTSNAAKIRLPNHTFILDDKRDLDFIKICNLKASRFVANSMKEWEEGKYPDATHVIFDEQEEVQKEASKVLLRNQCIQVSMKMSTSEKLNLIQILSNKSYRGRSEDFVTVEISKIIDNDPEAFKKYATMDKASVHARACILEGLERHLLNREGLAVKYMGEKIGNDLEDAVMYFMNPDNQLMKAAILEKLQAH